MRLVANILIFSTNITVSYTTVMTATTTPFGV